MEAWRNELYHHGILGQKWGVRRYQNYDGSLTAAGRARYNVDVEKAEKAYQNAKQHAERSFGTLEEKDARMRERWAMEDLKNEKIKSKLNIEERVSKRRQKLIDSYKSRGMNQEEAEIAAYKRERVEKAMKIALGVTVAAAVAYGAYRYHKYSADVLIPQGATMARISANPDKSVHDAFYAAMTDSDKHKYKTMYARQIFNRQTVMGQPQQVFQKKIDITSGLKVASKKNAVETLRELYNNDSQFRKDVDDTIIRWSHGLHGEKQIDALNKAVKALGSGKVNGKVYDAFNLILSGSGNAEYAQKFRQALRDKGYDAIQDINDIKLSGYRAENPIIVLNASKVAVSAVSQIDKTWAEQEANKVEMGLLYEEIGEEAIKGVGKNTVRALLGIGVGTAVKNTANNKRNDQIVREYREQHPNTKMSYTEIVRSQSKT